MKITMKKSLAVILSLVMCVSVLFGLSFSTQAADVTNIVNYVYATVPSDDTLIEQAALKGKTVVYNWGTRGEKATFLSPKAVTFYQEYDMAAISEKSGGTIDNAPSSELYTELHSLMFDNHSFVINYDSVRSMLQYTDCQGSGLTSNKISTFYSGKELGPAWYYDNQDLENSISREHIWPNSKGKNGSDEDDIMMLRPVPPNENSSRQNKAYGSENTSSYYHPNTVSNKENSDLDIIEDGELDLRGDVARILLYHYVRWECTDLMWGSAGVIESKDILLDWMAKDPVDTWEMGRNDSVESITGTRNVFVDYPELAYALFNEETPTDFSSPSAGTSSGGSEPDTTPATVKYSELGSITKTVSSVVGQTITLSEHTTTVKDGYTFLGWIENSIADEVTDKPATIYEAGKPYTVNRDTTLYALYSRTEQTEGEGTGTASYKKVTSAPADWSGEYLIVYEAGNVAFNGGLTTLDAVSNTISVEINGTTIESNTTTDAATFTINASGHIKSKSGYYIGNTDDSNKLYSSTSTQYINTITFNADGSAHIVGSGKSVLRFNSASNQTRFRYFKSSTYTGQKAICLYKYEDGSSSVIETTYYFTSDGSEPIYTVSAVSNDETHGTVSTEGYVITANPVAGYKVSGCSISPENAADVAQDGNKFTVSNLTANVTVTISFEALQSDGYYVKVDGALNDWSGEYLIVYEDDSVAFNGGLDKLDVASNTISVDIVDGKIAKNSDTEDVQFTIAKLENDNYSIKSASGYYIGNNTTGNILKSSKSYSDIYDNKISFDENVKISGSGNTVLQFYSATGDSGYRFRYYASKQKDIALYKYVENFDANSTLSASVNNELYGTYSTISNIVYAKPAYGYHLKSYTVTGATAQQNGNMFVLTDITGASINFEFATNEYTLYFKENGTVISTLKGNYKTTVDLPTNIGNAGNGEFVGWALEGTTDIVTEYEIAGNANFVAIYKETESGDSGESTSYYEKVTSTEDLTDGQYLIVYEAGNVAFNGNLTTLDGVNNTIGISFKTDGTIEQQSNTTSAEFTISAVEGGHSVTSASGYYIYKTAYSNGLDSKSSSNAFKTDYINVITFDASGNAILTTGNNSSKTTLRFNAAADQKRFRYYKSGQQAVQLYKLVQVGGDSEPTAEIKGAQVEVGESLAVNYYVELLNADIENVKMRFTLGEDVAIVENSDAKTETINSKTYYVFTFANIPPQHMTNTIKAEVYLGTELLTSLNDYSIQQNAKNLLAAYPNDEVLKQFIADMLYYGEAAQLYRNYKTDNLAATHIGVSLNSQSATSLVAPDFVATPQTNPEATIGDVYFTSATVWFDTTNSIIIKVNSTKNATLKVNGEAVAFDGTQYKTDKIKATEFGNKFVFELYDGETLVQTLEYSVDAYAYAKHINGKTQEMKNLAKALYYYGKSAEAYAAAIA